jgi:hypothetical protein
VLPADQHNAGKADYLGNELGLLPKGVGDNRCQTKPCCERRDCFERALARVARGGFRVGCVDYSGPGEIVAGEASAEQRQKLQESDILRRQSRVPWTCISIEKGVYTRL